MTEFSFYKLLAPIKNKIFLMIGRGVVKAINNSEGTQKIQIVGLKDETISDIERLQEYGFESYPKKDSEALVLFLNGNREQGIVIKVHDRENRPKDLQEGDSCMYIADGLEIRIDATGITLKSGDAMMWKPNTIVTCPLTGVPHSVGIVKLKGA